MSPEFAGIVLAGGRSSRMGRDKAMLPWGEGTLLDRMVALLRAAGASTVHVSGDRPAHGGLPDASSGGGPLVGLATVLARCADGAAVVVPVDLPCLQAADLHCLLRALARAPAAAYAGHPLPCALRVDTAVRTRVAGLARSAGPTRSLRALMDALGAARPDAGKTASALAPCNTPADWAALSR